MRLGIIGLPGSGKSTILQALTQSRPEQRSHKGHSIVTVRVPDQRVDALKRLFKPDKTVYAQLEYMLPYGEIYKPDGQGDEGFWNDVRTCDAMIHVVRNFHQSGGEAPHPQEDFLKLETDMIFADLVVVETRIERLDLDKKRGKDISAEERRLLEESLRMLEDQTPLRDNPELAGAHLLKGYTLLSAKPVLVLFNNDDEDETSPSWDEPSGLYEPLVVRGKLEMELGELSPEEAAEFLTAYHIKGSAMETFSPWFARRYAPGWFPKGPRPWMRPGLFIPTWKRDSSVLKFLPMTSLWLQGHTSRLRRRARFAWRERPTLFKTGISSPSASTSDDKVDAQLRRCVASFVTATYHKYDSFLRTYAP
jgi:ribosome-binding ATPase YchF (GTP1/OBG family)